MIVDASVVFKWLVEEPDSDKAIAWINSGETLSSPNLVIAETGNALTKRIRRGELATEGARDSLAALTSLLDFFDEVPFAPQAFDLSIALRHSFYDCIYLAAAQTRGERLLTADRVFAEKLTDPPLRRLVMVLGVDY